MQYLTNMTTLSPFPLFDNRHAEVSRPKDVFHNQPDHVEIDQVTYVSSTSDLHENTRLVYAEIERMKNQPVELYLSNACRDSQFGIHHLIKLYDHNQFSYFQQLCDLTHCPDNLLKPMMNPYLKLYVDIMARFQLQHQFLTPELIKQVVEYVQVQTNQTRFKEELRLFERKAKENLKNSLEYVDGLFKQTSRILVVRVDFSYSRETLISQVPGGVVGLDSQNTSRIVQLDQITAMDFVADVERLREAIRKHPQLGDSLGFMIRIEYGLMKGLHCHAVFFYDNARIARDVYYGQELGNLWKQVTEGKGVSHNCNAQKAKYKDCGIGVIHRDNLAKRELLRTHVVGYLCKSERYLRWHLPNGKRGFFKGWDRVANGRPKRAATKKPKAIAANDQQMRLAI